MDYKIKTSLVAAAVSSVLASTAFAATQSLPADKSLPHFDLNASIQQSKFKANKNNVKFSKHFQANDFQSGTQDRFSMDHKNARFNVNTLSWATPAEKIAPVAVGVLNRKQAATQASAQFAQTVGLKHGVTSQSFAQADLSGIHDLGRGAVIARYQQKANGLEVLDRRLNVVMNQEMELVATTGFFAQAKAPTTSMAAQFKLSANEAIQKAFTEMGGDQLQLEAAGEKAQFKRFSASSDNFHFSQNPGAKMVYYPTPKRLVPAYMVEIITSNKAERRLQGYLHVISAEDGTMLRRVDLKNHSGFSYRVPAQDHAPWQPHDSPMGTDLTPHPTGVYDEVITETPVDLSLVTFENSGISTNDPWLPEGATTLSGNNVDAYADLVEPDGYTPPGTDDDGNPTPGDVRPEISSEGTFDYSYDTNALANSEGNINAAMTNLFYTINYMHDTYYDHGFTEVWGTAQMDNYGRGGAEGDPLLAEGLDSSGIDNANMLTTFDGTPPRMQMYLWAAPGEDNTLRVGDLNDVQIQIPADWGGQDFNLEGKVIRMTDSGGTTACTAATNGDDVAGKVAIVDRGDCEFGTKALNAQNAGAIAVFIANNDTAAPDDTIAMGGGADGAQVTIPAAMVSYNTGQAIYAELDAGRDDILIAADLAYRDGTIDNTIVEHEWGHYITNRITQFGISGSNQGRSMGEGWSDFYALVETIREEDQSAFNNANWGGLYSMANYALNHGNSPNAYYFGLRRAPYTTDMAYNALTFKHIEEGVPLPDTHPLLHGQDGAGNSGTHRSGEIWANAMHNGYMNMLNRDGVSFEDARSKMRDYMVASLKIVPDGPTFLEMRDAVLISAIADDVENYNALRAGFTSRGMGLSAVAPSRFDTSHTGVVEDFESSLNAVTVVDSMYDNAYVSNNGAFCDNDGVLDVGETAALKFKLQNLGDMSVDGVKAKITSDADITFNNDGMIDFEQMALWHSTGEGLVEAKLNSAVNHQTVQINIEFMSDDESIRLPEAMRVVATVNFDTELDDDRKVEGFDEVDTVMVDWTIHKLGPAGSGYFTGLDTWTVISGDATGLQTDTMMGPDGVVQTDVSLITPKVMVGASGEFAMNFTHYYDFETSPATQGGPDVFWDGGVIEISVDGGDWTDVVEAGGTFATGYNGEIYNQGPGNVLSGRPGFGALISSVWLEPDVITFPDGMLNGKEVQMRFRIGTDGAVGSWGWNVDDVSFTNATNTTWSKIIEDAAVCDNRPPALSSETQVVAEASDGEQSAITLSVNVNDFDGNTDFTYSWSQVSGPTVMLDDTHSATPMFTAPVVGEDTMLKFMVEVSDGMASSMGYVSVNLTNVNSAPTVASVTGPESVVEGSEVMLHAMASDPENDGLTYTWMQTAGSDATFEGNGDTLTFMAPSVEEDETVTFSVVANDGELSSEAMTVSFMVMQNAAPVVTANESAVTVKEEQSVDLSVSGSDADGDSLTYTWMVDGTAVGATGSTYTYTAPKVTADQTVTVTVTATDGIAVSDPATITVTVDNKSGGGSTGLIALLLAPLAFIRRRKFK